MSAFYVYIQMHSSLQIITVKKKNMNPTGDLGPYFCNTGYQSISADGKQTTFVSNGGKGLFVLFSGFTLSCHIRDHTKRVYNIGSSL